MFFSVQKMELMPTDAKVCKTLRSAYYQWRRKTLKYDQVSTGSNEQMMSIETKSEVNTLAWGSFSSTPMDGLC
jgi:hypothetical protein